MALDPVNLDDLKWSEMVVSIRRRIAAAAGSLWTLHAPVDPGVTLLELFAWLLEQRTYWMDQVPDSMVRAALSLLNEAPLPARAAQTVFYLGSPNDLTFVPARTLLRLVRSNPPIVFSTTAKLWLLPFYRPQGLLGKLDLIISNRDRTEDLEQGKVLRLFPANGGAAEVKIVLKLKRPISADDAGKRFSLLFDLGPASGIRSQWSPESVSGLRPPAAVKWLYRSSLTGQLTPFPEGRVDDGTAGLRRSGLAVIAIPEDWEPEPRGYNQYALWMRVERTTFTFPPRLRRLIPNVVIAAHERMAKHYLHPEWLPLPGNVVGLAELSSTLPGEKDHPPLEAGLDLRIREADRKCHVWRPVADLAFQGTADRVFTLDRQQGELRFGDGLTGRLPRLSTAPGWQLKVRYRVGGGSAGNVGENREWEAARPNLNWRAVNLVAAEGGRDPETMAAARERTASQLRAHTRAVTPGDYEELARTTPGLAIKRARAAIGVHPAHPCRVVPGSVTVFIVPDAPREENDTEWVEDAFVAAPVPDPGMLFEVRRRLDAARLIASEVFVLPARYRPVSIVVEIESGSADQAGLRRRVEERLIRFLDPLIGGDTGEGRPFGEPLRPSAILRQVQQVLADEGQVTRAAIKLDDGPQADESKPDGEDCTDTKIGAHDLIELKRLTIRIRRNAGSQGGLR